MTDVERSSRFTSFIKLVRLSVVGGGLYGPSAAGEPPGVRLRTQEFMMGTWGTGFWQDDLALDIRGDFTDCLKRGLSPRQASDFVLKRHADSLADDDSGTVLLAVAEMQWKYGALDSKLLNRAKRAIDANAFLLQSNGKIEPAIKKRHDAARKRISKLGTQNPKPSSLPKAVNRPAPFLPGDCLSIHLSNGQFGAALVLAADNSNPELGKNLVALLDYMSTTQPSIRVFENRKWLRLTHGHWNGELDISWYIPMQFRKAKHRIAVVGNIKLVRGDPKQSTFISNWSLLGTQIVLNNSQGSAT